MAAADTQTAILDAAERLFAEHGFGDTSLRAVIAEAEVNLAAVHYHFGSKEALLEAALARRFQPLNAERLRLLDALEAAHPRGPLPLEPLLEAMVAPAIRMSGDPKRGGDVFMRLAGRLFSEPGKQVQAIFNSQFREVARRFTAALQRALPKLPPAELHWRIHFMIGAMAHTMCGVDRLRFFSGGLCDPSDKDGVIRRLITFMSAGLRAPLPGHASKAALKRKGAQR